MAIEFAEGVMIRGPDGSGANVKDKALKIMPRNRFDNAVINGNAFSWASLDKVPAAGDTILAVENNDTERDLYIHRIFI